MDLDWVRRVVPARGRADLAVLADPGAAVLAGGTWLYSEPQPRLHTLVDLAAFDWPPLSVRPDGLEIAATCPLDLLTRHRFPVDWTGVAVFGPCREALLASWKIWPLATVGGNVCLGLPAGSITAALVTLRAQTEIWSAQGDRRIPVADLVVGPGVTGLARGEVVRAFHVPVDALRSRVAVRRIAYTLRGRSGALVAGMRTPTGEFRLVVTAATVRPVVLEWATAPDPEAVADAVADLDPAVWFDDPHGAPDWRCHVAMLLAREVLRELR
jgi:CO/xanthine dehydrogenase FAD-binding subunit